MANFSFGSAAVSQGFGDVRGSWTSEATSRTALNRLSLNQPNLTVVGLVLTKQAIRSFPDKKNPGAERFKFSFTIRDSQCDYINATCWGSEQQIYKIFQAFRINDIVEIRNVLVQVKPSGDEDKWRPTTPSTMELNLSAVHSSITLYSGWDYTEFASLVHIPIRSVTQCYKLNNVITVGNKLHGSHINLLVAVKNTGNPRSFISKGGKSLRKNEVIVLDETCLHFSILMWDTELIDLSQTWTAKENIIFLVDVRVAFDEFKQSMIGICDQKTIITTNPECQQAHSLYHYMQSLQLSNDEWEDDTEAGATDAEVMTVAQFVQKQTNKPGGRHSAMIYAFLTTLDIDGSIKRITAYRCSTCKFRVKEDSRTCPNQSCSSQKLPGTFSANQELNVLVSFSDHTGGVDGVVLAGSVAEEVFQHSVCDFVAMTTEQRTELKVQLLLERFKVVLKSQGFATQRKPLSWIVSMTHADPEEAAEQLSLL